MLHGFRHTPQSLTGAVAVPTIGLMTAIPFRHFVEVRRAWSPAISPDGTNLAYVSDLTGYPEAYLHRGRDREPLLLTEFRERVGRVRWTPDGRLLVLDTDLGGDERWAIRTVSPDGTVHRTLSRAPEVMHILGEVSPDGRLLSIGTNARDPARFDVCVMDIRTGITRVVLADDRSHFPGPFSPDGRFILASTMYGSFRQELLLVPVRDGEPMRLTPEEGEVRHLSPAFDATGTGVLVLTDRDRDFLGLARIDLESRAVERLHAPSDRDVALFALSGDGSTAFLAENHRGWSRLLALDLASGAVRPVGHPVGTVVDLAISRDGSRGAFGLTTPACPGEIHTADLTAGESVRATLCPREGVPEGIAILPVEVRFRSFDDVEIPGWLHMPTGFSGRRPAIVKLHGGPESQARPGYDPIVQYLLSRGFAVYEPNVRGSTGYGRRFAALDDRRLRFDAVKDLAEAARFLKEDGRVDADRLSLLGGSYGGFMVLAGLAFFPDLWCAGVDICGIANFRTFLANTGPYRREWRMAEYGDPATDGDFLDEISPVHHAERIRAPLLVIQGANDPRVPVDEAEQILAAVRRGGGVAEYLAFPDEGHGIVKLPNRLRAYEAVVEFLKQHGR